MKTTIASSDTLAPSQTRRRARTPLLDAARIIWLRCRTGSTERRRCRLPGDCHCKRSAKPCPTRPVHRRGRSPTASSQVGRGSRRTDRDPRGRAGVPVGRVGAGAARGCRLCPCGGMRPAGAGVERGRRPATRCAAYRAAAAHSALSSNSVQRVIPGVSHGAFTLDRQQIAVTLAAIREVVEAARTGQMLAKEHRHHSKG